MQRQHAKPHKTKVIKEQGKILIKRTRWNKNKQLLDKEFKEIVIKVLIKLRGMDEISKLQQRVREYKKEAVRTSGCNNKWKYTWVT